MTTKPVPDVRITSFGYLHDAPPPAHLTLDLRAHFRDPHINPALRELTAHDQVVVDTVLGTPGIGIVIDAVQGAVLGYLAGPSGSAVTVAIGCAGGRHRAAAVAAEIACRLQAAGISTQVSHRDIDKPVINRPTAN
ncbi:ATPase [Streptomyces sp. NPDC087422]|uniref:RapZ C-terminal domain-containing protein n=1 Tax=Streptomyces sp. NPDC087422 TaxID=3365786 RepID=UPI00381B0763